LAYLIHFFSAQHVYRLMMTIDEPCVSTMIFIARVRVLSKVFRVMPWSSEDQGIPK
jgi:hypothetical protein